MKRENEIRATLLTNTIHLIALGGFERATTRAIVHDGVKLDDFKMNEVYIYRLFGSKEQLYDEAFGILDREVINHLSQSINALNNIEKDTYDKLWPLFQKFWNFLLRNEEKCRCYVRYYYSAYFKDKSLDNHRKLFDRVVAAFSPLFVEEADVTSIMHYVLTTILDFAIRVYNGDLENTPVNEYHVFKVLYNSMKLYFKDSVTESPNKT